MVVQGVPGLCHAAHPTPTGSAPTITAFAQRVCSTFTTFYRRLEENGTAAFSSGAQEAVTVAVCEPARTESSQISSSLANRTVPTGDVRNLRRFARDGRTVVFAEPLHHQEVLSEIATQVGRAAT